MNWHECGALSYVYQHLKDNEEIVWSAYIINKMQSHRIKSLWDNNTVNVMLGLTNPHAAQVNVYKGYDITKLRDNQRFLEVMLSRDGTANATKALYFDGAVSYFRELPGPKNPIYEEFMEKVYATINRLREQAAQAAVSLFTFKRGK